MKVLISADMEGISGVVSFDCLFPNGKDYDRFRRLMTADVNAAIEGALAGGGSQVVVTDAHGGKNNILIEELHPAAELICGDPAPGGMMQGIGPDIDAVFCVGYHAASGVGPAVISHTVNSTVCEVRLNARVVGELGFAAASAGSYGVPVVLVTGDKAVADEALALLGDVETVVTKEAVGWSSARCLNPKVVQDRIRTGAERALGRRSVPFVVEPPIVLSISFSWAAFADVAALVPGSRRTDGRTVEWTGENMPSVKQAYRAMTLLAGGRRMGLAR